MQNLELPLRSFFSFSFACHRRQEPPRIDGNLREWEGRELVPDLMSVEGQRAFARVYMAWDDAGLYFGVEVPAKTTYHIDPRHWTQGDCLELWVDTRDLKDVHRAHRYCHRFYILPGGTGPGGRQPIGRQTTIDRAREQAPPCPEETIKLGLRRLKSSYQLEVHLPGSGLNGFQPGEFDRLGFAYLLHDSQHGTQSWSAGPEAGVGHDPSTWGTVELRP